MKSTGSRLLAIAILALVSWIALAGAAAQKGQVSQPDKLIILSTTDVKGKTSPCG
jgi:aspartate 1-decarboxylase